jgi:uncharacterized membrane protein
LPLRSNHLIGMDVYDEYYLFRTTLDNLHWSILGHSLLDACLSISLLPTIYQSILNISPEFICKILYSLIYSITPLAIYIISKRYIREFYAFLTACFFMFQMNFLWTAVYTRANVAILFFALAMMTLFSDKIDPLKKRILFIVFMASCMVSHYSTTYIFFFIMLGTYIGVEILSKKYTFKKVVSLTIVVLFFALIFFWYSQVTGAAFNAGVGYIENTLSTLNRFFVEESRGEATQELFGKGIVQETIPRQIEWLFTWLTFAFVSIGIATLLIKRKEMSFSERGFKKAEFLKVKFEVEYSVIALACSVLLVIMVALPFISLHYSLHRLYGVVITILSVFFVIGGISLSKQTFKKSLIKNLSLKKKLLSKKQKGWENTLQNPVKKSVEGEKSSEVRAYVIILLVLIPYFFCVTGVTYQVFGYHRAITLNSEGELSDYLLAHDQDVIGAKWLIGHGTANQENAKKIKIYADNFGGYRITLACDLNNQHSVSGSFFRYNKTVNDGYIYLRYANVITGKVYPTGYKCANIAKYSQLFIGQSKIYNNGGSYVYC